MAKVTFRTDLCKGCGLCVNACPKGLLAIAAEQINAKGYSPAVMTSTHRQLSISAATQFQISMVVSVHH